MSRDFDAQLQGYLTSAAKEAAVSVNELLHRVLHLDSARSDSRFLEFFAGVDQETRSLLLKLDSRLRVLNPGLHYVYRATYLGYRREGPASPTGTPANRSQVFLSVLLRNKGLLVVLPLDPRDYEGLPGCRDVGSSGHHGVGDLEVEITVEEDLRLLFSAFGAWLRPQPDSQSYVGYAAKRDNSAFYNKQARSRAAADIRGLIEEKADHQFQILFFDLRDRLGLRQWSASRKVMAAELLADHGVECQPPLTQLSLNDWVTLSLRD